ncbi:MAG: hypothetical protein ACRD3J_10535, partial [Thermoanaerobaculia bacterium]
MIPVVFIIVSLLSLALLPVVFGTHTAKMRTEITAVAEPSRLAASKIQADLSTELDEVIAYQVTTQNQYRNGYRKLLADQLAQSEVLARLGRKLGPDVEKQLRSLKKEADEWHAD